MFNIIILFTILSIDAERVLKHADRVLRNNYNLPGFHRIDSGYEVITTDGFGNPYGGERDLKVYGIAVKVPDGMDYRTALAYLECGTTAVNCYAEFQFANI